MSDEISTDGVERIGPHDLGGLPGGPVDRTEHDAAHWERQVDAMVMLMRRKGVMIDPAQLRRGIESLDPDVYEKLSYYERWAGSAALNAIEQGLVTQAELDARIESLRTGPR
ncbi:MAG: nitrile hydratase subunit beta [bacterium]|nr:nitrile hydratase subunit beta [bacterium]